MILVRAFIFSYIQSVFSRKGLKLVIKSKGSNFGFFVFIVVAFFCKLFHHSENCSFMLFFKKQILVFVEKKENYVQYLFCCLGKPGTNIGLSMHIVFQQDLFLCYAFSAALSVNKKALTIQGLPLTMGCASGL